MNFSATAHSLWTCVGLRSKNDCCFSLQCSFAALLSHFSPNAVCRLCSAHCFNQGSCGAEAAVRSSSSRGFGLYLSSPALPCGFLLSLSLAVCLSLFFFFFGTCLLCEAFPHCDDSLMNFSLCYISNCYLYISPLSLALCFSFSHCLLSFRMNFCLQAIWVKVWIVLEAVDKTAVRLIGLVMNARNSSVSLKIQVQSNRLSFLRMHLIVFISDQSIYNCWLIS